MCGTKGGIDFNDGVRYNTVRHDTMVVEKPNIYLEGIPLAEPPKDRAVETEMRIFLDAITKGTPVVVKPEQALVVTQILEAIYESGKTGKAVYLDE